MNDTDFRTDPSERDGDRQLTGAIEIDEWSAKRSLLWFGSVRNVLQGDTDLLAVLAKDQAVPPACRGLPAPGRDLARGLGSHQYLCQVQSPPVRDMRRAARRGAPRCLRGPAAMWVAGARIIKASPASSELRRVIRREPYCWQLDAGCARWQHRTRRGYAGLHPLPRAGAVDEDPGPGALCSPECRSNPKFALTCLRPRLGAGFAVGRCGRASRSSRTSNNCSRVSKGKYLTRARRCFKKVRREGSPARTAR